MTISLLKEFDDTYEKIKTLKEQLPTIKTQKEYHICLQEIEYQESRMKVIQYLSS